MDDILKIALLGTAKQSATAGLSDHPADQLLGQLTGDSADQVLLLRAGTRATYQLAGHLPEQPTDLPPAAAAEDWPCCSPRAAGILAEFLKRNQPDLLAEACQRLAQAGQRLPPRLLPDVLEYCTRTAEICETPEAFLVLGQRGRWLCQFNDKWRKFLGQWDGRHASRTGSSLPPDSEAIWTEGSLNERKAVLSKVRFLDADRGRQWLETVWAAEKADTRAELLEVLATGLSPVDQPFLEQILTDASKRVRSTAARFLCRFPDSGLAQRMRSLAEEMLIYSLPKSAGRVKSLVRSLTGSKRDSGKLSITPPKEFDKQWERDGIQEKAPAVMGKREFWLIQVMERIPPSHWESHFQAQPGQLVMAAAGDDFGIALLDAWSKAAQYFLCHEWMAALWDFWFQWAGSRPKDREPAHARLMELLKTMKPADREPRALTLLEQSENEKSMVFCRAAEDLPRPWSETLAQAFVAKTRRLVKTPLKNSDGLASWAAILECAARAIPPACFSEALKPWDIPETDDYSVRACRKAVGEFIEIIRLRSDFLDAVSSK